jgi:hypothetical protein
VGDLDETKVLDTVIGDYNLVAVQGSDACRIRWYVGAVNDEVERNLKVELSFLELGKAYGMVVYEDSPAEAPWEAACSIISWYRDTSFRTYWQGSPNHS